MASRRANAVIPLGLLLLSGLYGCQQASHAPESRQAPVVQVAHVAAAPWAQPPLTGTVVARTQSRLAFQVGGRIAERRVERGQHVAKGALLYALDEHDLKLKLAASKAQVHQAEAQARFARENFKRVRQLLARKVVGQQDYDQALSQRNSAEAALRAAHSDRDQARRALDYARLTAPFAGVVTAIEADQGDVVAAGQPVLTLAADGARLARVDVPERRLDSLPKQAHARLYGDKQPWQATQYSIAGAADPVTRTWAARYTLSRPELGDKAPAATGPRLGQTVQLMFPDERARRSVPLSALSATDQSAFVLVIDQGRVKQHPVRVLRLNNERAVLATDLPVGTAIVAAGINRLHDGEAVRLQPGAGVGG